MKKFLKSKVALALLAALVLGTIGVMAYVSRSPQKMAAPATNSSPKPIESVATPNSAKKSASTAPVEKVSSPAQGGGQLSSPTGQLLSKRAVSLRSSDPQTNADLESVCQTAANASCDIKLTMGSLVKYVGAQNTGSDGTAIFDWNANKVGLSAGSWTVQAVATQNGKTGVSHSETLQVNP